MASISARASGSATPTADTRSATVAPSNAAGGIPRVSPITVKPRLLVAAAPPGQEAPRDVLERLARFSFRDQRRPDRRSLALEGLGLPDQSSPPTRARCHTPPSAERKG